MPYLKTNFGYHIVLGILFLLVFVDETLDKSPLLYPIVFVSISHLFLSLTLFRSSLTKNAIVSGLLGLLFFVFCYRFYHTREIYIIPAVCILLSEIYKYIYINFIKKEGVKRGN